MREFGIMVWCLFYTCIYIICQFCRRVLIILTINLRNFAFGLCAGEIIADVF